MRSCNDALPPRRLSTAYLPSCDPATTPPSFGVYSSPCLLDVIALPPRRHRPTRCRRSASLHPAAVLLAPSHRGPLCPAVTPSRRPASLHRPAVVVAQPLSPSRRGLLCPAVTPSRPPAVPASPCRRGPLCPAVTPSRRPASAASPCRRRRPAVVAQPSSPSRCRPASLPPCNLAAVLFASSHRPTCAQHVVAPRSQRVLSSYPCPVVRHAVALLCRSAGYSLLSALLSTYRIAAYSSP